MVMNRGRMWFCRVGVRSQRIRSEPSPKRREMVPKRFKEEASIIFSSADLPLSVFLFYFSIICMLFSLNKVTKQYMHFLLLCYVFEESITSS